MFGRASLEEQPQRQAVNHSTAPAPGRIPTDSFNHHPLTEAHHPPPGALCFGGKEEVTAQNQTKPSTKGRMTSVHSFRASDPYLCSHGREGLLLTPALNSP